MTQGLGGEEGREGGGEVLGKLLASRQTPFIGLYQSQLRRASPSASHTGGVAEGGSITEQHLARITQHHTVSQNSTQHPTSVGLYQNHTPSISITCKESGEGTQSHLFKVLSCLFLNIVVNCQRQYCVNLFYLCEGPVKMSWRPGRSGSFRRFVGYLPFVRFFNFPPFV